MIASGGMNNQQAERAHILITGRVQGVGFRYFVKQKSEDLGLTGWVRNLPEGQVEVLAEGAPPQLDQLLALLSVGPTGAIVIDLSCDRNNGTGEFTSFRVLAG